LFADAKVLYSSTPIWTVAFPSRPGEDAVTESRNCRPWGVLTVLALVVVLVADWDSVLLVVLEPFVLVVAPCCVATRNPPASRTVTTTDRTTTSLAFNVLQPQNHWLGY